MNINLVLIRDSIGAFKKYAWVPLVFTMTRPEEWHYPAARVLRLHKEEVLCIPCQFPVFHWIAMQAKKQSSNSQGQNTTQCQTINSEHYFLSDNRHNNVQKCNYAENQGQMSFCFIQNFSKSCHHFSKSFTATATVDGI